MRTIPKDNHKKYFNEIKRKSTFIKLCDNCKMKMEEEKKQFNYTERKYLKIGMIIIILFIINISIQNTNANLMFGKITCNHTDTNLLDYFWRGYC